MNIKNMSIGLAIGIFVNTIVVISTIALIPFATRGSYIRPMAWSGTIEGIAILGAFGAITSLVEAIVSLKSHSSKLISSFIGLIICCLPIPLSTIVLRITMRFMNWHLDN